MNKSRRSRQVQSTLWQIRITPSDSVLLLTDLSRISALSRAGCCFHAAIRPPGLSFGLSLLHHLWLAALGALVGGGHVAHSFVGPAIAAGFHLGRESTVDLGPPR